MEALAAPPPPLSSHGHAHAHSPSAVGGVGVGIRMSMSRYAGAPDRLPPRTSSMYVTSRTPPRPDSPRPGGSGTASLRASRLAQTRVWGVAAAGHRSYAQLPDLPACSMSSCSSSVTNSPTSPKTPLPRPKSVFSLPRRDSFVNRNRDCNAVDTGSGSSNSCASPLGAQNEWTGVVQSFRRAASFHRYARVPGGVGECTKERVGTGPRRRRAEWMMKKGSDVERQRDRLEEEEDDDDRDSFDNLEDGLGATRVVETPIVHDEDIANVNAFKTGRLERQQHPHQQQQALQKLAPRGTQTYGKSF